MKHGSLRTSADFARVFRTGRRGRSDGVTAYAASADVEASSRLGLAIRCRRAVDRNLLKRRLRSAWGNFEAATGFEVAVRADEAALRLSYQELERHLYRALTDAGVDRRAS